MGFKPLKIEEFNVNPFTLIGKEWMLITAADKSGKVNTMTASWGGLGVMWNKNVAFIVIRPTRYTWQFVEQAETFSLTFFDPKYKKQLSYLGSVSGRDEDKITKCGLTTLAEGGTPYFAEANCVVMCRKLYAQAFQPQCFVDAALCQAVYDNDYHTLYVGEIERIMVKE